MNQLRAIIAGVDFSECSRSALEQAVRMATWNNARLRVIHAIDPIEVGELADALHADRDRFRDDARQQAVSRLDAWMAGAGASGGHGREVIVGAPVDVFLQEVRAGGADILVLGVTGESRLPNGAGTFATKCLRKAPTKVMLVKEGHSRPFRSVVACVDFSEMSHEVVVQALRVGMQDGAQVHFLHVFTGPWRQLRYRAETPQASPDFERQYRAVIEGRLRAFVGATRWPNMLFTLAEAGSHGHGIAEYARQIGADLVVLGTKGRTNLKYVLLGSTAEQLLREAPCSVLTVRLPTDPVA